MKRGSITPFCAMMLMIVAAFVLTLLESARVNGLAHFARLKANATIDSVCAEYQPLLWQQYGLLFLDGAYGTEEFSISYVLEHLDTYMEMGSGNAGTIQEVFSGLNLFGVKAGDVLLEGYALATDSEGELFLNYVAEREKENLSITVAADVYQEYKKGNELTQLHGGVEESIAKAQRVIGEVKSDWIAKWELEKKKEELEEEPEESEEGAIEFYLPDTSGVEGVLDRAETMFFNGILNMIFTDSDKISTTVSKPESHLQFREKEEGNMHLKTSDDWYQRILVLSYLERYFSNYVHAKEDHFLTYEMEYVLCGNHTERENLAETLEKIMLIREAANVAHVLQDKEKMEIVAGLAEVIGFMAGGNPAVVKVVEAGLVGAWAYMESILDVRSLVAGEEISLIKNEEEWTTNLSEILAVFDKATKARPCENGLGYTDYLKQLLCLTEKQQLAYRMMEVMEMGMRSREVFANSQMDHMLVMLRCKLNFESKPLFSSLVSLGDVYRGNYYFVNEVERSYVP